MSTKEWLEPDLSYKPDDVPVTPYLKAKEEWDNRIGTAREQAFNWRICALGLLAMCLALTFGLIYQSSKSMVTPYIVHLGPDGAAKTVGPIYEAKYTPREREIKYFLGQLIHNSRGLPFDPYLASKNWQMAYNFLKKPKAVNKMNQIMEQSNTQGRLGKETIDTTIIVIVKATKDTYQIEWKEEVRNQQGMITQSYIMTGFFTVEFSPPKTEAQILVNPLGLYVTDFQWNKKI